MSKTSVPRAATNKIIIPVRHLTLNEDNYHIVFVQKKNGSLEQNSSTSSQLIKFH